MSLVYVAFAVVLVVTVGVPLFLLIVSSIAFFFSLYYE